MIIMCDSTCDLSLAFLEEKDLHLFPALITLGEKEYRDILDIDTSKIYNTIKNGIHPKTAQVAVADFYLKFKQIAKEKEEGIYISVSSGLSGTYNTALMALKAVKEEFSEVKITVIDSRTASIGIGVMLSEALEMRAANRSLGEVTNRMEFMANNLVTLFTLSDLNWVAKGGRISKTAATIGSVLQINPVMELINGKVVITEKIRGKKKVMNRMIEVIKEKADQIEKQIIGVAYSEDIEKGKEFLAEVESQIASRGIVFRPVGASVATHAGLGTLGIAYLKKYSK
ncbi:DegV family protein [Jeotgalibaca porci]|uniref:DegV family protein n=2 Tax=Jeotgalibaca porci TaxID=1868793 RepID=UPI0035A15477